MGILSATTATPAHRVGPRLRSFPGPTTAPTVVTALAAFALAGCVELDVPTAPRGATIMVSSILRVDSDTAAVSLLRIPEHGLAPVPVSGARVVVASDEGSTELPEHPTNGLPDCFRVPSTDTSYTPAPMAGCYTGLLPAPVQSGARYRLHVELPSGDTITGEAVAPEPAWLASPEPGAHGPVAWRAAPEAAGGTPAPYAAPILTIDMELAPGTTARRVQAFARVDSVFALQRGYPADTTTDCSLGARGSETRAPAYGPLKLDLTQIRCEPLPVMLWDSAAISLLLVAADANYDRYLEDVLAGDEVVRSAAGPGLDGATGVFGIVAVSATPYTVVCVDDQPDAPLEWFNCVVRASETSP